MKRIISWNVNGIRAAEKKGFIDWIAASFQSIKFLHTDNISPRVDSADVISLGFVPPISIS